MQAHCHSRSKTLLAHAMQRRTLLCAAAAAAVGSSISPAAHAAGLKPLGRPRAFSYAALKGRARALAAAPYKPDQTALPAAISALDYDQYQSIRFKPDHALWADDKLRFRV